MVQCPNCGRSIASAVGDKQVAFHVIRGVWSSWEGLFQEAADFASRLGPERLISISHSEDDNDGVVTVWYWS